MIRFTLLFIMTSIYANDSDDKYSDHFLPANESRIEQIDAEFSKVLHQALKSGLTSDHRIKLQNLKKEITSLDKHIHVIPVSAMANQKIIEAQKERLYRISKLSLGLSVNKAWVIPFILLLLIIAFAPLITPRWWNSNLNKSLVSLIFSIPVILMILHTDSRHLLHTGKEYFSFIILIGSLFIISGGIYLHGRIAISPFKNTVFLMFGAILANFIGTTGAAMVLFRPFIMSNNHRSDKTHLVMFFIFIICNCGGLLTPLGDPPLFLGFIRGVPFEWTLKMLPQWLFINGVLLAIFYVIDFLFYRKEPHFQPLKKELSLSFHGKLNMIFLSGVVASAFLSGYYHMPFGCQEASMIAMTILSLLYSPLSSYERKENDFTFTPFIEVAVLFAGIFATMIPCLILLETWGPNLNLSSPAQFFWASGMLSQFLDNAPTFLTFSSIASSLAGTDANHLGMLALHPEGMKNLIAICCGSVFMGANTYIGNAPNFMVKALAEEHGIRMPSFFGYMLWSIALLFPVYLLCTILFFMG